MKIQTFKRLIKEAVAEVIHEELPDIISEVIAQQNKKRITENKAFNLNSNDVSPLGADAKQQLFNKIGSAMGYNTNVNPNVPKLEVIPTSEENNNPYLNFILDSAVNMTPTYEAISINKAPGLASEKSLYAVGKYVLE